MSLPLNAEEELILCRKLCCNDHDAGLVPSRPAACAHKIQQGRNGYNHLSRYIQCGEEYRDSLHCVKIAGVACDR